MTARSCIYFLRVDMNVDCLDEKAVITYIACLCDAMHRHSAAAAATHRQEVFNYHYGCLAAFFAPNLRGCYFARCSTIIQIYKIS